MQTPPPKRTGWLFLVSAVVIGLVAAEIFSVIWGVSLIFPLLIFGLLGLCVGFNWLLMTAWDRWRQR